MSGPTGPDTTAKCQGVKFDSGNIDPFQYVLDHIRMTRQKKYVFIQGIPPWDVMVIILNLYGLILRK